MNIIEEYANFVDNTKKLLVSTFHTHIRLRSTNNILIYQYHLYSDNIAHKYTDDHIV